MTRHVEYPVENSASELRRLERQAALFDPFTRAFLREAGVTTGMRVLDVGSGAGDVAFLVANLVGPAGAVVGTDTSAPAVAMARARARAAGISNVEFLATDPTRHPFAEPFDAVVGRLALMYFPDPAAAIGRLAEHLRRPGLLAFQEADYHGRSSVPAVATYDRCMEWIARVLAAVGAHTDLGFGLYRAFVQAGLPAPALSVSACTGGGPDFSGYAVMADVIRGMLPNLERFGIATAGEVDVETLAARIREEVVASSGVVVLPTLVGARVRLP